MKNFTSIFIALVIIAGIYSIAESTELTKSEYKTRIIAHRGASAYAPENTMAAFKAALDLKAEMFELDIHKTLDGKFVVIHDDTTERTTGFIGAVAFMNYSTIKNLDAGSLFNEKFKGEPVPLLKDVLKWAKGKIQVNIEIKSAGCEKAVVAYINKIDMKNDIIVTSFHHEYLKTIKEMDPDIRTGALVKDITSPSQLDEIIEACHPDAVNPRYILVNKKIVKEAHKRGLAVNPYTVNDAISMKKLISAGVDGIITNYPDVLRTVLENMNSK
ncbi:MAG TPA: glycerophosphodiester phosphodiesterase family protein [bacterium]|nr:glycerophosphodiester phosphodiesterase family protein [bacterium]